MRNVYQAALGFLAALLSGVIIIGSLTLSFVEGGIPLAKAPSSAANNSETLVAQPVNPVLATTSLSTAPLSSTSSSSLVSPSPQPATSTSLPPTATLPAPSCDHPQDWIGIFIQMGDTLQSLAQTYGTTPDALRQYNCLPGDTLPPNTRLFVPPLPSTGTQLAAQPATQPATQPASSTPLPDTPPRAAATNTRCGPPPGWFIYTVRPGDTLFQISILTGTSIAKLQSANCLGSTNIIRVGQQLYVPVLPATPLPPTASRTPKPTATFPPPSNTPLPPPTDTPVPPTLEPPTVEPPTAEPPTAEPTTVEPPTLAADTPTSAAAEIEETFTPIPPTATEQTASEQTATQDDPVEPWPELTTSPTAPATPPEPEATSSNPA